MNQVSLAIRMLFILKTQGIVKKNIIADQLEISEKMVQRLRFQLELSGYEIQIIKGKYGGYKLSNTSFFPVSQLTMDELNALTSAYSSIQKLDLPFNKGLFKKAFEKVIGNNNSRFPGFTLFNTKELIIDETKFDEIISKLQTAIMNKNIVDIHYFNDKIYIFEPYEVFQLDNAWYVIGYKRYSDVRIFRIDRIDSLIINTKKFIRLHSFNLESHLNTTGFKIEEPFILKGNIKNPSYLKEFRISDHQVVDDNYFELKFYNKSRCKRFILEQGSNILITEPTEFIEYHKSEALKVINQYE